MRLWQLQNVAATSKKLCMKKIYFDIWVSVLLCLAPLILYMMSLTDSLMLIALASLCLSIGSGDLHKLTETNRLGTGVEKNFFWWPRLIIFLGVIFVGLLFNDFYFG